MKIVADENIPFVSELFSPLGDVTLLAGRKIRAEDVRDADVLLVRSVTRVDRSLLEGASVRFVGTCTIGLDHLDRDFLDQSSIAYASAPGCNANAVVQYVVSVLAQLSMIDKDQWAQGAPLSAVVVGGGNVGSRVYQALEALGFNCACVDPFLDPAVHGLNMRLRDFDAVFDADLVCVHTPLTLAGSHPTYKMFTSEILERLRDGAVLLNAGRGEVVDNEALSSALTLGKNIQAVLDVWDGEPRIHPQLLSQVRIGTPHIAGYSFEGRVGGSLMIFDALCEFLVVDKMKASALRRKVQGTAFGEPEDIVFSDLTRIVLDNYDVSQDVEALCKEAKNLPESFDLLRKHYPKRREYSHYRCLDVPPALRSRVSALGFGVDD